MHGLKSTHISVHRAAGCGLASALLAAGFGALGDLPVNTLVRDDLTGDLYVGNDFAVLRRDGRTGHWHIASRRIPVVEISSLAIDANNRVLDAATHGRSAWRLDLRKDRREHTDVNRGSGRK